MIYIEQIRPEHTWWLRRDVLYPGSKPAEMQIAEDPDGIHFGAFQDGLLVGVVSLFHKGNEFQFRKLAIKPEARHQGIGTALLDMVTEQAGQDGGTSLWCNARTSAIDFYIKNGFAIKGDVFTKNKIDYQVMDKLLKQ